MNEITVALIGAGATIFVEIMAFIGIIISNSKSNEKMNTELQSHLETAQAVTDTKLEELTREVREHNGFARRMPVVEEKIKVINHRLEDIENDLHKNKRG